MIGPRPPDRRLAAVAAHPALPEIDRALSQALSAHLATAAACMFTAPRPRAAATVLHHSLLGTARRPPPLERLLAKSVFDVGALTQTLVTATLAAVLVSKNRLDLSRTLGTLCADEPGLRQGPWRAIPLEALLDHTSGLPAADAAFAAALQPLRPRGAKAVLSAHEQTHQAQAPTAHISPSGLRALGGPLEPAALQRLRASLQKTPLQAACGTQVQPSALNALALGWALEAVLRMPLDVAFATYVTEPLQLSEEMYFVRCGPNGPWQPRRATLGASRVVASRPLCPVRQRPLQGECEDDVAYFLGGVAGHAGLFCSVDAVVALLQAHLEALQGRGTLFNAGVVQRFWTRSKKVADSPFALGWQVVSRHNGMAPGRWNARSIGQLSATGSCMFIDPAFGVVGALLLNLAQGSHTEPQQSFDKLRLRVFDTMASEGQYAPGAKRPAPRR